MNNKALRKFELKNEIRINRINIFFIIYAVIIVVGEIYVENSHLP